MPPCITKRHLFNHCIARIQQDVVDFATSWLLTVLYTSLTIHVYSCFTTYLASRYLYLLASWLAIFFFCSSRMWPFRLSRCIPIQKTQNANTFTNAKSTRQRMQIHQSHEKSSRNKCTYHHYIADDLFFFLGIFKCCFVERVLITGWRRLIRSPKLHIIFHKRAAEYRALLLKMTYEDKGSYESSPPCTFATWMTDVNDEWSRHFWKRFFFPGAVRDCNAMFIITMICWGTCL